MKTNNPFAADQDQELGRLLRDELAGPDPDAYLGRLRHFLGQLPQRDTEWDVLARWARPRVVVAAMAAAFLLGVALFSNRQSREPVGSSLAGVPAGALMAPTAADPNPITFAGLEGR